MTDAPHTKPRIANGWRIAGWGSALALLLLPAFAMQFTDEVDWTASDFVFAGLLLGITGIAAEVAVRLSRNWSHLIGYAFAIFAGFFTLWSNAAVGIIGSEDALVNTGFFWLIPFGLIAAFACRLKPRPLAHITGFIAVSQIVLGFIALYVMPGHAVEWGILIFFAMLWGSASLFFRRAADLQGARAED